MIIEYEEQEYRFTKGMELIECETGGSGSTTFLIDADSEEPPLQYLRCVIKMT